VQGHRDFDSIRELLMAVPGGIHIQQSPDPLITVRELFLDVWRTRDLEIASAIVMNIDAVLHDTSPAGRALSRISLYLRESHLSKVPENQKRWDIPIQLGYPHAGDLSGEFLEISAVLEASAPPERRRHRSVAAWANVAVRAVLSDDSEVRHLLPFVAQDRRQMSGATTS